MKDEIKRNQEGTAVDSRKILFISNQQNSNLREKFSSQCMKRSPLYYCTLFRISQINMSSALNVFLNILSFREITVIENFEFESNCIKREKRK